MDNYNNPQAPFWEFLQAFDPSGSHRAGAGVDHFNGGASNRGAPAGGAPNGDPQAPSGSPFDPAHFDPWGGQWAGQWGGGPWGGPWAGPWGRRGGRHSRFGGPRHHREGHDSDSEDPPEETPSETVRETSEAGVHQPPPPPSPGAFPHPPPPPPGSQEPGHPHHHPHHHHGPPPPFGPGAHRRWGGRCGRGGRGGRGGRHGPPPSAYEGPFDFRPLMQAFSSHPFAQTLRNLTDQTRAGPSEEQINQQEDTFVPPVDVFNTEKAYILHVSLPGAAKEDIGVNWDGEKVNIAGVVYRPGDEEFLKSLASSERKIGMFEKSIKLPPPGVDEKEDVDGFSITAKMDNGILVVTVPKTEKEWTEIHKIDVE
ncbi:Uu.00g039210.m01.CDS01 [Anthostomella pinea]|uniref:Uu.00g039210.m01.CDS01 n=1 Tax=Anthostomella pinea TaxID=933095 RepID=A0AAI8V509_9PEZI|nr:Uu.00g039210.m01.CDS01 [Anthostomella pinea]